MGAEPGLVVNTITDAFDHSAIATSMKGKKCIFNLVPISSPRREKNRIEFCVALKSEGRASQSLQAILSLSLALSLSLSPTHTDKHSHCLSLLSRPLWPTWFVLHQKIVLWLHFDEKIPWGGKTTSLRIKFEFFFQTKNFIFLNQTWHFSFFFAATL